MEDRLRSVERKALSGDRQAMAQLLVEENRAGISRFGVCHSRGTHRWAGAEAFVSAIGTHVGFNFCIDCEIPEIEVRRRDINDKCPPHGLVIRGHRILRFENRTQRRGFQNLRFRTLCGFSQGVSVHMIFRVWADLGNEVECGSCVRATPERKEEAMRAGPELHTLLRDFTKEHRPDTQFYTEVPVGDQAPRTWINGQWQRKPTSDPPFDPASNRATETD